MMSKCKEAQLNKAFDALHEDQILGFRGLHSFPYKHIIYAH